eukprot:TRINITY_DN11217_c0_g1_i5.p1 TRINITY_DN11217_c0_g1~~TRINITY_DN11217_c0_g1_i5.p1  ORF type:complete len:177 (+),score=18.87 TRINITY_DN11217_c0_g1_i5:124-654(+)
MMELARVDSRAVGDPKEIAERTSKREAKVRCLGMTTVVFAFCGVVSGILSLLMDFILINTSTVHFFRLIRVFKLIGFMQMFVSMCALLLIYRTPVAPRVTGGCCNGACLPLSLSVFGCFTAIVLLKDVVIMAMNNETAVASWVAVAVGALNPCMTSLLGFTWLWRLKDADSNYEAV